MQRVKPRRRVIASPTPKLEKEYDGAEEGNFEALVAAFPQPLKGGIHGCSSLRFLSSFQSSRVGLRIWKGSSSSLTPIVWKASWKSTQPSGRHPRLDHRQPLAEPSNRSAHRDDQFGTILAS